jgi:hypothetical protein
MHSAALRESLNYECAHCKQVNRGEPARILLINNQNHSMCCEGCAFAAQLLQDIYRCQAQNQRASER